MEVVVVDPYQSRLASLSQGCGGEEAQEALRVGKYLKERKMSIYKRYCDYCGEHYEGRGRQFCSRQCSARARGGDPKMRFWNHVQIMDLLGCWAWKASKNRHGQGRISWNGRGQNASRVVWEIAYGEIPDGLCVCHHCDNPGCVNPIHLFLATHAENMADRDAKGRQARGEKNAQSKLTERQVLEIRELCKAGGLHREIGKAYGVSKFAIGKISQRISWSYLEDQCEGIMPVAVNLTAVKRRGSDEVASDHNLGSAGSRRLADNIRSLPGVWHTV